MPNNDDGMHSTVEALTTTGAGWNPDTSGVRFGVAVGNAGSVGPAVTDGVALATATDGVAVDSPSYASLSPHPTDKTLATNPSAPTNTFTPLVSTPKPPHNTPSSSPPTRNAVGEGRR